jgi:putative ABC transport system permease protein
MNLFENFRIALRALSANKLRSALTMLGIIIGVAAVVALMAIGTGATASITGQVQGTGSNLITVVPGQIRAGPGSLSGGANTAVLLLADEQALAAGLPDAKYVVPIFQGGTTTTYQHNSVRVNVIASQPIYPTVRNLSLAHGRLLTGSDGRDVARVAVLGSQTATDLFGPLDPLGQTIKINGTPFKVVGVLTSSGASGFSNSDQTILVPLEAGYEKLFGAAASTTGRRQVSSVLISAKTPEAVNGIMTQTDRILRRAHGLTPAAPADFSVLSQQQLLSTLTTITTTLTVFLGAIAGISLLVGGIGIMNIMLVSVTERTREIGLRKAVGAKQSVILLQFLVETMFLSITGGLIGIGLGWGIAELVTLSKLITTSVTPNSVALAFLFSSAVGVFFGLYPAYRASRLRPIEALRYE